MDLSSLNTLMVPPDIHNCKRILCVQPHPDDNEIGMGGIISTYADKGCEIHYLTVTNGDLGTMDERLSHEEVAEIRSKELEEAGRFLGASVFHSLHYGDGTLENIPRLAGEIAEIIRTVKPEAVFCPDPWLTYEAHYDHIITGKAVAHAFLSSGLARYPKGTHTHPWQVSAIGFYFTASPNLVIDTTDVFEKKFKAIELHRSQFNDDILALYRVYFKEKGRQLAQGKDFELGEGLKVLAPVHLHCFVDAVHI
ncbi:PIG-L deacetylase family protein [Paenibacillus wynnii]|uniref:PIG-L deacetylase family protein n=1 Tax=Paenibacillus wynnii TaxID=268407 RepID=UPI002790FECF|nr:PIG-L deacetylase family protein [Paenibacillus wynnii]MDQ0192845.1 LmbE family N-acetylglucosaminyl deacetylase [Paenibacillus wynnii]